MAQNFWRIAGDAQTGGDYQKRQQEQKPPAAIDGVELTAHKHLRPKGAKLVDVVELRLVLRDDSANDGGNADHRQNRHGKAHRGQQLHHAGPGFLPARAALAQLNARSGHLGAEVFSFGRGGGSRRCAQSKNPSAKGVPMKAVRGAKTKGLAENSAQTLKRGMREKECAARLAQASHVISHGFDFFVVQFGRHIRHDGVVGTGA